jgi:hypothetical protein
MTRGQEQLRDSCGAELEESLATMSNKAILEA